MRVDCCAIFLGGVVVFQDTDAAWVFTFGRHPLPGRVMRSMVPRGVDWHTRKVLAWWMSNTLEVAFCVDALKQAIRKFDVPEIMNTEQASQRTSFVSTDRLRRSSARISMDGKGRFLRSHGLQANHCRSVGTLFVERLWRIPPDG